MGNNSCKSYQCCIIGAGPAGLGAALELVKQGISDIIIIDKNKTVGGLSRTDIFDGIRYDVGPHRFFTKNQEVSAIWYSTLGDDFQPVSRLTRIFYKNKFFNYPIKPLNLLKNLSPLELTNIFFSFAVSQINKKSAPETFESWVIQKFGSKFYETFFKTYTEKVWGMPCNQISADWAAQRIKGLDVLKVIQNALFGGQKKIKTLMEEFDYPVLGAGQMYETIVNKLVSQGVELMLESKVIRFNRQEDTIKSIDLVKSNGQEININAKQFFSSVPLAHYFKMLNPSESSQILVSAGKLKYRDHITVDLLINQEKLFPDQWIYVHSPDVQIARVANYKNFSIKMMPDKDTTTLSVEYFTSQFGNFWNETDEFLSALAVDELEKMCLIKRGEVKKCWVVRETEAYPVYSLGFKNHYDLLKARISQFVNFYSIGRAGMHKYNNQDHSIISGILAVRNYLKLPGFPFMLWDINIDAEYQESNPRMAGCKGAS
jgi:protoporphyrinogen oxidase